MLIFIVGQLYLILKFLLITNRGAHVLSIVSNNLSEIEKLERNENIAAHRLVFTEAKSYSENVSDFLIKYQNFMYAPRTHFLYKTVNI